MGDDAATRLRTALVVWIDALGYAVAVAAAALLAALVAGIATGGGVVRAKGLLFVSGLALMGYATFRLWPTSPEDLEDAGRSIPAPTERPRFQAFVRALPPLRWLPVPPPARRMDSASKLFVASVLMLVASYLMETAFGIV